MNSKTTLLATFLSLSYALPSGSPMCDISGGVFSSAHGAQDSRAGYGASAAFIDGKYRIELTRGNQPIHGVLLYVTGDGGKHLGSFESKDGYKFVQGCYGSDSTITHSHSNDKGAPTFAWVPSGNDKGPFELNAIITGDRVPWQKVTVNLPAAAQTETQTTDGFTGKTEKMMKAPPVAQQHKVGNRYEFLPDLEGYKTTQSLKPTSTVAYHSQKPTATSSIVSCEGDHCNIYFSGESSTNQIGYLAMGLLGLLF